MGAHKNLTLENKINGFLGFHEEGENDQQILPRGQSTILPDSGPSELEPHQQPQATPSVHASAAEDTSSVPHKSQYISSYEANHHEKYTIIE